MLMQQEQAIIFADINSLKHNHIVGIQDTATESGRFLIKEFISNSNDSEIHVFCYDCDCSRLREELGTCEKFANFYDCLPELTSDSSAEDELEKFVSSMNERQCRSNKLLLIIDSLSTLFLQKQLHVVYRILRQLSNISICAGNKVRTQIVAVVHEDTLLTPKQIITQLKILCRVWIKTYIGKIHIAVRKKTGKILSKTYKYDESSNDRIQWQIEKGGDMLRKQESDEGPVSTFKLTLSEREKKARDAVRLPYERHTNSENEEGSRAAIIYEPDEFDDWDEEDPDNDLEFS